MVDHIPDSAIQEAIDESLYEDALCLYSTLIEKNKKDRDVLVKKFLDIYRESFVDFIKGQVLSVQMLLKYPHNIEPEEMSLFVSQVSSIELFLFCCGEDIQKSFFRLLKDRESFSQFKLDNHLEIQKTIPFVMRNDPDFRPPSLLI